VVDGPENNNKPKYTAIAILALDKENKRLKNDNPYTEKYLLYFFLDADNYSVETDDSFLVKPVQPIRKVNKEPLIVLCFTVGTVCFLTFMCEPYF
jgi:hypothetical protein